jgi:NAD(P)H-dependent FMN reductase
MSKILLISATSEKNLELANELQSLLRAMGTDSGLVVLDKLNLPLYSEEADIESGVVEEIIEKMKHASGFIFCAPEYNGSVPPVLSNAITWISVKSKNWRDVFNGKFAVIGTHSGGDGYGFLTCFSQSVRIYGDECVGSHYFYYKRKTPE